MSIPTSTPHGYQGGFWNTGIGWIGRPSFDITAKIAWPKLSPPSVPSTPRLSRSAGFGSTFPTQPFDALRFRSSRDPSRSPQGASGSWSSEASHGSMMRMPSRIRSHSGMKHGLLSKERYRPQSALCSKAPTPFKFRLPFKNQQPPTAHRPPPTAEPKASLRPCTRSN